MMLGLRSRGKADTAVFDAQRGESYPYPYPTGWYRIASSDSIRPGEIRAITCLGKQFVLWRARESGESHLMDAFCPHLGANLAGGRVDGDCIECPFHLWQFDGEGRAQRIPYSDQPPERVLTRPYELEDVHGQLFLYHRSDAESGDPEEPPAYEVPRISEVDEGSFVRRGQRNAGRVRMHIIEICENAADTAHFQALHSQLHLPWTQVRVPGVEIVHRAKWVLDEDRPWMMHFDDAVTLRALGRTLPGGETKVRVSYHGPGSLLTFRFDLPGWGELTMVKTFLPISPLEQQIDFQWYAPKSMPRWLVWWVIGNWVSQFPQDIDIWENKTFQARPRLSRDDGPVIAMRRWYQQFLPEPDDTRPGNT
ncbi:MAG: Rieske 2Fe-2S domain-containing protein [Chloroflexi bacterium]|nr:Rieske 2Fe-2S domain-containing protein [Chloroflexota bacterium]MYF81877.1 Rieske 2Fe-2S domain-containing protein [Chloroflexota bacterium]MYI04083.1 Rieske 2Fe-2S domain-containing protein [Chloroflexota bacterium]